MNISITPCSILRVYIPDNLEDNELRMQILQLAGGYTEYEAVGHWIPQESRHVLREDVTVLECVIPLDAYTYGEIEQELTFMAQTYLTNNPNEEAFLATLDAGLGAVSVYATRS